MNNDRDIKYMVVYTVLPKPFGLPDIHELTIQTRSKEDTQNIKKLIEEYFNGRQ